MGYFLPELSVAERIAMPVIKLNDQQFLLRPGTNRLGGGDLVEMSISPDVSLGVQAIVEVTGTEGVVIRPVPGKEVKVLVNGVPLTEPTPLAPRRQARGRGQGAFVFRRHQIGCYDIRFESGDFSGDRGCQGPSRAEARRADPARGDRSRARRRVGGSHGGWSHGGTGRSRHKLPEQPGGDSCRWLTAVSTRCPRRG